MGGGKWVITLPIEDDLEEESEAAWTNLILALIGADFPHYEKCNGTIYSVRDKHLRISVWVKKNFEHEKLLEIGNRIREVTKLPKKYPFCY